MLRRLIVPLALALGLSGCLVGPNYHRPAANLPAQFPDAPATGGTESIADKKWFDLFQDATLKQYVDTALEKNFDVRIAAERVIEARAQYGITRANLFPTLDAQASFTSSRSSALGAFPFPPGTPLSASTTQAGLQLSWELDLWGRLRRLNEAARAQYLASEEVRHGVIVSLISDVMTTYFTLRELDLELDIGRQNNGIAHDNLRLIQLRKIVARPMDWKYIRQSSFSTPPRPKSPAWNDPSRPPRMR